LATYPQSEQFTAFLVISLSAGIASVVERHKDEDPFKEPSFDRRSNANYNALNFN